MITINFGLNIEFDTVKIKKVTEKISFKIAFQKKLDNQIIVFLPRNAITNFLYIKTTLRFFLIALNIFLLLVYSIAFF
jgi:hypothetical protein